MKMNLNEQISDCLDVLYSANQMMYDYWVWTLFDEDDEPVSNEWNEKNLKLIQKDVEVNTYCNL